MHSIGSPSRSNAAPARAAVSCPPIALCPRCRREILPRRAVNALRLDMWRSPSKGMTQKPDPDAERVKARKARKRGERTGRRNFTGDTLHAVKLILRGRLEQPRPTIATEECPDCQSRQRRSVA